MDRRRIIRFLVLCFVPMIMVLGNSMLIPVFPTIRERLALTQVQTGLIITAFSIPSALLIPVAGILADRFGRKKVLIPGLAIYGGGGLLAGLAGMFLSGAYSGIIWGRIAQGVGAAGTTQIAMTMTGDIYEGEEKVRALSYLEAANGTGKVLSPLIGSAAALIAWFIPFFVYPLLSFLLIPGIYFLIDEPRTEKSGDSLADYYHKLRSVIRGKRKVIFAILLDGFLILATLFGSLFYLAHILDERFGVTGFQRGLILALPVLAIGITSVLTGRYLTKSSVRIVSTGGLVLILLAYIFQPLTGAPLPTYILFSLVGIGTGMVLPLLNAMITGLVPIEERGVLTSLYGSIRFLGAAAGPPLFGFLLAHGEVAIVGITSFFLLGAAASNLIFFKGVGVD